MNEQYKDKFIQGFWIDTELCDRFVHHFHNDGDDLLFKKDPPRNYWGRDLNSFTHNDGADSKLYVKYIYECLHQYSQIYPQSQDKFLNLRLKKYINVQYYEPDECYSAWHWEKNQELDDLVFFREIVFMTYLNDCEDGHTSFLYQNLDIRPQKGLTIIWPGDWTHTHKGNPSKKEKNVITGWFVALPANFLRDTHDNLFYYKSLNPPGHDLSLSY